MNSHVARSVRFAAGLAAITALAAFAPRTAAAHPSVSVVVAPDGRVYFSDLEKVWVLEPNGTFRVAVPDVHTHELRLGGDGSLYGEDVRNRGDVYRARYWRLTPAGQLEYVTDWIAGHPNDIGFPLMEPADTDHYWVRLTGGEVRLIRRDGTVRVLAENLIERTEDFDWLQDRHALMKPWTDPQGRVYVPIYAGQKIVRLSGNGAPPEVVFTSESGWSPTGGVFEADGTLWIQEWGRRNQPRLRRIDPSGAEEVFDPPG